MEKLLSDIKSWDQEKEDNWRKCVAERDAKIAEIQAERDAAKEKIRRAAEEAKALEAQNNEDDEPKEDAEVVPPPEEGEDAPAEEKGEDGEDGEEKKEVPSEEPIVVEMDGDSDDDFAEI